MSQKDTHNHPVYEFVEVIQKEQTATEVSITQLEAGARPPRRALKAINRNQNLKNALTEIQLH